MRVSVVAVVVTCFGIGAVAKGVRQATSPSAPAEGERSGSGVLGVVLQFIRSTPLSCIVIRVLLQRDHTSQGVQNGTSLGRLTFDTRLARLTDWLVLLCDRSTYCEWCREP